MCMVHLYMLIKADESSLERAVVFSLIAFSCYYLYHFFLEHRLKSQLSASFDDVFCTSRLLKSSLKRLEDSSCFIEKHSLLPIMSSCWQTCVLARMVDLHADSGTGLPNIQVCWNLKYFHTQKVCRDVTKTKDGFLGKTAVWFFSCHCRQAVTCDLHKGFFIF